MAKFSIIVPAHNAEGHIRKALDSIKMQTYPNYELIVVCDSCEDRTAEIAKEYGAKVIEGNWHRDGLARNAGLDAAVGEWILFMDDDDWWLHEYVLELLDRFIIGKSADAICFSFIWKGVRYARPRGNKGRHWIAVWNKCWKREFIGETRFSDKEFWSDVDFHNEMMKKNGELVDWDMPLYYYNFLRKGSICEQWLNKTGEMKA